MSQKTVRISAGYSDKTSENYNSTSYSINLEMDAHINGTTTEIEEASNRLFQLCRKIVNHQKGVSVDNLLEDNTPTQPTQQYTAPTNNYSNNNNRCSEKQVKCIYGVAKGRGMTTQAISSLAQRYGKKRLGELTSSEASLLIKKLKQVGERCLIGV